MLARLADAPLTLALAGRFLRFSVPAAEVEAPVAPGLRRLVTRLLYHGPSCRRCRSSEDVRLVGGSRPEHLCVWCRLEDERLFDELTADALALNAMIQADQEHVRECSFCSREIRSSRRGNGELRAECARRRRTGGGAR